MFHIGTQVRCSHAVSGAVQKLLAIPSVETRCRWYSSYPAPLIWKVNIFYGTLAFFGLKAINGCALGRILDADVYYLRL